MGYYHKNPILNTLVYDVKFPDGELKEYSANVISENLLSQVDDEGFYLTVFDSILEYTKDDREIEKKDLCFKTRSGTKHMKNTTCGWKFLVLWKDGSETWVPLKDTKESHPIEIAEFAKSRRIDKEPAFDWWITYTLQKRDIIISAINTRIQKTTHKYGIEIPRSVKHASAMDLKNGNNFWVKAIKK